MSVFYCSYCRRNVGSEGPTRDVRYITCKDCYEKGNDTYKNPTPTNANINARLITISNRLNAIEETLARFEKELNRVEGRTDPRLYSSGVGY